MRAAIQQNDAIDHIACVGNPEIDNLKDEIRSALAESAKVARQGRELYALSLEHQAAVAMRSLIRMGAL